jgi:hypothetical protein
MPAPAVKARVLSRPASDSGHFGQVNDVIEVTQEEAGHPDLDANPDAVAYAESLKKDAEA